MILLVVAAGSLTRYLLRPFPIDYTVAAQTATLSLRTYCGQKLAWDLPRGFVRVPGQLRLPDATPEADGVAAVEPGAELVSVTIEQDVIVTLTVLPGNRLSVVWALPSAGGERAAAAGLVTVGGRTIPIDQTIYYESELPLAGGSAGMAAAGFTFPLAGRVILGDDIPYGSGVEGRSAPVLQAASVVGRADVGSSRYGAAPRKTLLEEKLDTGDLVDTHPEFDNRADRVARARIDLNSPNPACTAGDAAATDGAWAAMGFVSPDTQGAFQAVLHRRASGVGVSHLGAAPFMLTVPRWHAVILAPDYQILIALFVVLTSLISLALNSLQLRARLASRK